MKHMLGLDYSKKPYRNYGFFYERQSDLEDLVIKDLAYAKKIDEGYVYHLTKTGIGLAKGSEK
jgi:hypothetical protein